MLLYQHLAKQAWTSMRPWISLAISEEDEQRIEVAKQTFGSIKKKKFLLFYFCHLSGCQDCDDFNPIKSILTKTIQASHQFVLWIEAVLKLQWLSLDFDC